MITIILTARLVVALLTFPALQGVPIEQPKALGAEPTYIQATPISREILQPTYYQLQARPLNLQSSSIVLQGGLQ